MSGPSPSERVFRALLSAYPASFRDRFGTDAVELFCDRLGEARARGGLGVALLWARTVPNVIVHGLLERASTGRSGGQRERMAGLHAAARALRRSPGLTTTILLTLGLGIGANVALFGVVRNVLLRPLPYDQPERIVRLWSTSAATEGALQGPSPLDFADWERAAPGFDAMGAWYLTSATYRTDEWVEEVRSAQVTADFLRVLGVRPVVGRDFRREEVVRYGPIILGYDLWVRRFGGDPAVVGTTIVASGREYEIIGVMPRGFAFPDESVESWIAWDLQNVYADRPEMRQSRFMDAIARLSEGATLERAAEGLEAVAAGLAEAYPEMNDGWETEVTTLEESVVGDVRATLGVAFAAVLLILMIACANVANLLLARLPARSRDVAVRTTLGATRGRIAAELAAEHGLLGVLSGVLGLGIGALLLRGLVAIDAGRIPRLEEVRLDPWIFAFAGVTAALTTLAFGLAPILHAMRSSPGSALADGRRVVGGRGAHRAREVFVALQVAIAVVLATGAGLFARSLGAIGRVDLGVRAERVATFRVSLDPVDGTAEEIVRYYDQLQERLRAVPGAVTVGAAQTLPLNPVGNDFRRPYRQVGSTIDPAVAPTAQMRIVTEGYADAVGMTLVEGANLPVDVAAADERVVLVNRTLARQLWPAGGGVGNAFEIDFPSGWQSYRVVGVVADVKHYGARSETLPEVFLSHRQQPYLAMSVVVRTVGAPEPMTEPLRSAVLSVVPRQPPHRFVTMERLVEASTAEERFLSILLATFAGVALVLAMTGVYGVVEYSVGHRRGEIGVRMALGARPERVAAAVVVVALRTSAIGMVAGLALAIGMARVVATLLFGVEPWDPVTLAATVGALLAVTALAAWLPARRAARVPPAEALRSE